jgi:hypothetical protein
MKALGEIYQIGAGLEQSSSGRRFLAFFGTALLLLALAHCLTYTAVDPNRFFFGSPFPQSTSSTRRDKLNLFVAYNAVRPVTGLILGSSRSMKLAPEHADRLTGLRFFNAGVFDSRPDDYLGMYRVLKDLHAAPRQVLIGIDAESLSATETPGDVELRGNYSLMSHLGQKLPRPAHYGKLYLDSFKTLTLTRVAESVRLAIRPAEPVNFFHADGLWTSPKVERQVREGTYDYRAELQASIPQIVAIYGSFHAISGDHVDCLESLLREASNDGARLVVWITPLHPELRSRLNQKPEAAAMERNSRAVIQQIAERYRARFFDFSEPLAYGPDLATWDDAVHYGQKDAQRILDHLLGLWRP